MSERKERSPRLGRGLASLLGQETLEPDEAEPRRSLPTSSLAPGPFQPRRGLADDALDDLTASIKLHGVLQPILVRPNPTDRNLFQIVAGERRWRAAQRAGLEQVPVHVRDLDDVSALAAALIENLQREDLNAIEEAEGLRRLADEFHLTQEGVAQSVGKSRSHVANMMRLLSLPESIQQDVRRGLLSAGHARALLTHPDPVKAALTVQSRGLNVRQTEALSNPPDRHPARSNRVELLDTIALEGDLTAALGLRVRLATRDNRGHLTLYYETLDQLEGLVTLLKGERSA